MGTRLWPCVFAAIVLAAGPLSWAATVEVLLEGLDNPWGLAIQPGTGHVFVSESGAGKVLRVVNGKAEDAVVGFGTAHYGDGPRYTIGPLGLIFIGPESLVVGGGERPAGQDLVRVFRIPSASGLPLRAEEAAARLSLPAAGELPGEGDFFGLAATSDALFVTCRGDDAKGWVARAAINAGKLVALERFIPTKEATGVSAPRALAISPRGELVVGQMGQTKVPRDSLVTFYRPQDGRMLLNLATGLFDITSLAYAPSGQLYATDFAWIQADQGGLFQLVSRLDQRKLALEARRIVPLDKPTAMVFAGTGALYVTVLGTAAPRSGRQPGQLLKITL